MEQNRFLAVQNLSDSLINTGEIDVVFDSEFKALIAPASNEELAQLEDSILNEGCRDALVVWNGILLDGHNRITICQKHDIVYKTILAPEHVRTREDAMEWIIRNQFGRRNLSKYERIRLALRLEEVFARKAKENQRRSGGRGKKGLQISSNLNTVDTRKELAQLAGVSGNTIDRVKTIEEKATPAMKAKLVKGEITIHKAFQDIKREEKRIHDAVELNEATAMISHDVKEKFESVCEIRNCSMHELLTSKIKPDCIITDPPYSAEYLPLYEELARLAKDVPVVAVMCGQSYLPQIMHDMCRHLKYRWTLAYLTPGSQAVKQWQAKVNISWKPVILFGEATGWFNDVCQSDGSDKRFHDWGQSESGMTALVDYLSKPGQLVCDPFVGGGTTAVVSLRLGRRFVGCDIDKSCVEKSRARCMKVFNV